MLRACFALVSAVAPRRCSGQTGGVARGEVFPIVHCLDLAVARTFYERALGGVEAYRFPPDGDPVYLTLRVGAGQVALAAGTSPAMYGEVPLPASGHAVDVCVYVPDLDAAVAAAPAAGGSVVVPPQDMPWGERVAYLRDPDGTMLLTIQDDDHDHDEGARR
jgi:lactoylglutathione lyase